MKRRFVYTRYRYIPLPYVISFAAGQLNVILKKNNEKIFTWGYNRYGQLGNNSLYNGGQPVEICNNMTFNLLMCGENHMGGVDSNGIGWTWGFNNNGQLGNNSTANKSTPVAICGNHTFCKISAGLVSTSFIDKNGLVWSWGGNSYGQLGDNTAVSKRTPISLLGATKTLCKIASGAYSVGVIDKDGKIWGWGHNQFGQLGINSVVCRSTPVAILGATKTFCKIELGYFHAISIDKYGKIWTWGYNTTYQLGDNSQTNRSTPVAICGATKTFCHISAGFNHSSAIDKNGNGWAWGGNGYGQLGINSDSNKSTPFQIYGNHTFCQIISGSYFSAALDNNNKIWGWGLLSSLGVNKNPISPIIGISLKTFCKIWNGYNHVLAIEHSGLVWGWGTNTSGKIGNNSVSNLLSPASIAGALKTFCSVVGGYVHSMGIDKNGKVWAWGSNTSGQLGDNTVVSKTTPISILGTKTFCHISVGNASSFGIDKNGKNWSWGLNNNGQLGVNNIVYYSTPVAVGGSTKTFCQISAGFTYSSAIDKNGQIWCWGNNSDGQLGVNSVVSYSTPVAILGATKTFCKIRANCTLNYQTTLAIDKNGMAWGWGQSASGQIGYNSVTSKRTPVAVCGNHTFCQITVSEGCAGAIDNHGQIWTWGNNAYGQLGNNSYANYSTPVAICGATKTFCHISSGYNQMVAIDKNGNYWAWGMNPGSLGINIMSTTPIEITV